jgi:hypothetical protein
MEGCKEAKILSMEASAEARQSGFDRLLLPIISRPIVGRALLILLGVLPAIVLLADI